VSRDCGIYRSIHVRFWNDEKVRDLSPHAKLLWFAIKTNPDGNMACLIRYRCEELSEIMGVDCERVNTVLQELIDADMVDYDKETKLLWLIKALDYEPSFDPKNKKIAKHLFDLFQLLPKSQLIEKFITYYNLQDTLNTLSDTLPVPSNSNRIQEQEQEKRFELLWLKYPKDKDGLRKGKKEAQRHFEASVKTEQDWKDINRAIEKYAKSETVLKGFVKNGSTWFNNWRDFIPEPEKPRLIPKPPPPRDDTPLTPEEQKAFEEAKRNLPGILGRIGKKIPDGKPQQRPEVLRALDEERSKR
jgi:hypothetical protein